MYSVHNVTLSFTPHPLPHSGVCIRNSKIGLTFGVEFCTLSIFDKFNSIAQLKRYNASVYTGVRSAREAGIVAASIYRFS